jgi:hypothetical protein
VYLTNALTGWNPPKGPKQKLVFPQMEEERDAAELVKREKTNFVGACSPLATSLIRTGTSCDIAGYASSCPSRYSIRHWNTWLAFTPCWRAITTTDTPGCNVSSTI